MHTRVQINKNEKKNTNFYILFKQMLNKKEERNKINGHKAKKHISTKQERKKKNYVNSSNYL